MTISVAFGGARRDVPAEAAMTAGALLQELVRMFGVDPQTVKLLKPKGKEPIVPHANPSLSLDSVGIADGMKLMMVASKLADVEFVRSQKEIPRMRGFDDEAALHAARRFSGRAVSVGPPKAEYTFQRYEVLDMPEVQPPPSAALALLYRLAADPGILGIMANHKWKVGILKEMPPEGKVGVSPVCILGLNVNAGQEIHLRLRTDDLRGFRRYRSIRDTLVHELTHMVFGDHDDNFKNLNSQLLRECKQLSWLEDGPGPQTVAGFETFHGDSGEGGAEAQRPKRLRDFVDGDVIEHWDPKTAAAEAAVKRLEALGLVEEETADVVSGDNLDAEDGDEALTAEPGSASASLMASDLSVEPPLITEQRPREIANAAANGPWDAHGVHLAGDSVPVLTTPMELDARSDCNPECDAGNEAVVPHSSHHLPDGVALSDEAAPNHEQDSAQLHLRKVTELVNALCSSVSKDDGAAALKALQRIISNALQNPGEESFRRIKCSNAAFQRRIARHPSALKVLAASGFLFRPASDASLQVITDSVIDRIPSAPDGILCLVRDDPALLWLSLSVIQRHTS